MRRLYHLPLSPFCRKTRLVLAEKKIEVELVEEQSRGAAIQRGAETIRVDGRAGCFL